jgi:hypothetical protein
MTVNEQEEYFNQLTTRFIQKYKEVESGKMGEIN